MVEQQVGINPQESGFHGFFTRASRAFQEGIAHQHRTPIKETDPFLIGLTKSVLRVPSDIAIMEASALKSFFDSAARLTEGTSQHIGEMNHAFNTVADIIDDLLKGPESQWQIEFKSISTTEIGKKAEDLYFKRAIPALNKGMMKGICILFDLGAKITGGRKIINQK